MLISIIVPAYKQENTILQDLENISNVMSQTRWDYEIICVADGILDKTLENVKSSKDPRIYGYGYEFNKGKGYAIRYGMARAKGDYIVFIDAGMDINPNGISMILEHMEWYNADIMVASKRHLASKVSYPLFRKILSLGYQILVRILFGLNIRDTQVGLKVFKRKVLEKVLPRLIVKRFAFDIEMLAVAHRLGFRKIFEAPVEIKLDIFNSNFSLSKVLFNKNVWDMFYDTISVFYRIHFMKYYDDSSKRLWVYDKDLEMRVNTGELK